MYNDAAGWATMSALYSSSGMYMYMLYTVSEIGLPDDAIYQVEVVDAIESIHSWTLIYRHKETKILYPNYCAVSAI